MSTFITTPPFLYRYTRLHIDLYYKKLRYHFHKQTIIYGIHCRITDKYYIGSSFDPRQRFRNHLITGHSSNGALQLDIDEHGLENITVYVFEIVQHPKGSTYDGRRRALRQLEQHYMDMFPDEQLYNEIDAHPSSS
jgi:group I intron endonuclease